MQRRRGKPTLEANEDIAEVLKLLSDHLSYYGVEQGVIHLGGGSTLAAAWEHRRSTDIDLWVSYEQADRVAGRVNNEEEWKQMVCPAGGQIVNKGTSWTEASAELRLHDVPITLFTSHFPQPREKRRQMIRGTIFAAATTQEILAGKLLGRWAEAVEERIPIRDIYDVIVARTLEPRALAEAMQRMSASQRRTAAKRLRALPENWHELDKKPVIDPQFEIELNGAGRRLATAIEDGDWEKVETCKKKGSIRPPKPSKEIGE